MDIRNLVKTQVANYRTSKSTEFAANEYISHFATSAQKKAENVLKGIELVRKVPTKRPVFVSIGGGDGSELVALLQATESGFGVLLEMDQTLCELAMTKSLPAKKHIEVVHGSAQSLIEKAMNYAYTVFDKNNCDSVVVTCHAVIHELYDRGTGFDPISFFSHIFGRADVPVVFTYREPGSIKEWPNTVLLTIDSCDKDDVLELAMIIVEKHPALKALDPAPQFVGDGIRLHKNLAIEIIWKLFYIEDIVHEIEERISALDHNALRNAIWAAIGDLSRHEHRAGISAESAPTDSFREKWEAFKIRVDAFHEDLSKIPLTMPESQSRIIAWRVPAAPAIASNITLDIPMFGRICEEGDWELAFAIAVSCGREWIERAGNLCELAVFSNPECPAHLMGWLKFLLQLQHLFAGDFSSALNYSKEAEELFPEPSFVILLQSERFEIARKQQKLPDALSTAQQLLIKMHDVSVENNLSRYCVGTSNFLLSNLLRHVGRYDLAQRYIENAENLLNGAVRSQAVEKLHCLYARTVCLTMVGSFEYAPIDSLQDSYSSQFSDGLMQLSYANAAWVSGSPPKAIEHALHASEIFQALGLIGYTRRAKRLTQLLHLWEGFRLGTARDCPEPDILTIQLSDAVAKPDASLDWLSEYSPSVMLGVMQFFKEFGSSTTRIYHGPSPVVVARFDEDAVELVEFERPITIEALDHALRRAMKISPDRRVPLIPD